MLGSIHVRLRTVNLCSLTKMDTQDVTLQSELLCSDNNITVQLLIYFNLLLYSPNSIFSSVD